MFDEEEESKYTSHVKDHLASIKNPLIRGSKTLRERYVRDRAMERLKDNNPIPAYLPPIDQELIAMRRKERHAKKQGQYKLNAVIQKHRRRRADAT